MIFEKMNPAVKALWVAALRSGDYKQCTGLLTDGNCGFCCLGVLCDVAVKEGVIPAPSKANNGLIHYGDDIEKSVATLPRTVINWAGLRDLSAPPIAKDHNGGVIHAVSANDGLRWSFEQIADAIERNL